MSSHRSDDHRLFDHRSAKHAELDLVRRFTMSGVVDAAQHVGHLRHRVRRS